MVPGFCRVAYYLTRTDLTLTAQLAPTNSILKERACWLGGRALRAQGRPSRPPVGGPPSLKCRRSSSVPVPGAGPTRRNARRRLACRRRLRSPSAALAARKTPPGREQAETPGPRLQAGPARPSSSTGSRHRHMTFGCATSADSEAPHCRDGDGASTGCEIHAERLTLPT